MKKKTAKLIGTILMWVGTMCFTKMFNFVDVYAPNKNDPVVGITFSNDEDYIDYIGEYEKTG